MTELEETLTDEEKDEMEQAAINSEREKTKYGSGIRDGFRGESDDS